jgi:uncharacterized protein (DUF427 family)
VGGPDAVNDSFMASGAVNESFTALRRSAREGGDGAYKGHASYWSVGGHRDLAWTYDEPLSDARDVAGYIAFLTERVDVALDGERLPRPVTPWS